MLPERDWGVNEGRRDRTVNTAGAELGAGVTILAGKGLYFRPQARIRIMSRFYVSDAMELGIGWRF